MTPEQEMIERLETFGAWAEVAYRHSLTKDAAAMIARLVDDLEAMTNARNDALSLIEMLEQDNSELLTIAYLDGSHRSTQAHRETIKRLTAERDAAREELAQWVEVPRMVMGKDEFPH